MTVSSNAAASGPGGGAYLTGGQFTMQGGWLRDNTSNSAPGGGLYGTGLPVLLMGVTVSGNTGSGGGGGISLTGGGLTMQGGSVINNKGGGGSGGGVTVNSPSTFQGVLFSGNSVDGPAGGALYGGPFNVTGSTFVNNSAGSPGGAIFAPAGLTMANSTVTGNFVTSNAPGGGIYANGTISNSTIVGNSMLAGPTLGAGVYGGIALVNTIVANNLVGTVSSNCVVPGTQGNNMSTDGSCGGGPGDQVNVPDVKLGPLQDNGGMTPTMAPLPGSPAIHAGNNAVCAGPAVALVDQRGMPRPTAPAICDVGAVEVQQLAVQLGVTHIAPAIPVQNTVFSVTVEAQTAGGAATPVLTNTTVALSLQAGSAPGVLGGVLLGTIPAGMSQVTFEHLTMSLPATGMIVNAVTLAGDGMVPGASTPTVVLGTAKYLVTLDPSGPVPAGSLVTATAQAATIDNRLVPLAAVNVTWSRSGAGGSFAPAVSMTDPTGKAVTVFTVGTLAGTVHEVIATDGAMFSGKSTPFPVLPAAPAKYLVTLPIANVTAGQGIQVAAQLADAFNNMVASSGRSVTWSALPVGGGFNLGATSTNSQGIAYVTFTPADAPGVGYVVTATDSQPLTGSSAMFIAQPPVMLRMETVSGPMLVNGNAAEVRIYADAGALQVDALQFQLSLDPAMLQIVDADGQGVNGVNLQTSPAFTKI
ncbi:MAG: hypothetical protein NTZ05_05560, partial [Chloroflexi bacterium]|nr:hypothetical protein [Chloroflexota bacterium]